MLGKRFSLKFEALGVFIHIGPLGLLGPMNPELWAFKTSIFQTRRFCLSP